MRGLRCVGALLLEVLTGVGTAGLVLGIGLVGLRALNVGIVPSAVPWIFASLALACTATLALRRGGALRRTR
ncbi:MAG: hypothetical protein KJ066_18690 [Acidobacteria bacterium]|nr:hypothetical protein [Acidobacteriota bacterium]